MTARSLATAAGIPLDMLDGKSILVTGGTGSFGRAFVRTVLARSRAQRIVVFSRDELKQSEMQAEFEPLDTEGRLRFFIGDVRDERRLEMAFRGIDIVVHAAAMKQVPTAEYNPLECIHTNVLGAENVVHAAINMKVKRVLALSTDKAANPINLYGASKLASDKIFVAANHLSGAGGPLFSVVRYGNVMGSRGSVIPFFRGLIDKGADHLPITDPRMTRFWITLEKGVEFVCSSIALMEGGEIYVPKIPSMRIVDLAAALAPGLPHRVVGIRPGEKLHEVMITEDDARTTYDLGDRYVIQPSIKLWHGDDRPKPGTPVPEGFRYGSDNNDTWLSAEELLVLAGGRAS
jgi:UDP-N-acetylglucosamine 4,6-dehydratase